MDLAKSLSILKSSCLRRDFDYFAGDFDWDESLVWRVDWGPLCLLPYRREVREV